MVNKYPNTKNISILLMLFVFASIYIFFCFVCIFDLEFANAAFFFKSSRLIDL